MGIYDQVEDPFRCITEKEHATVLEIFKRRLPLATHIYNMAFQLPRFPGKMECIIHPPTELNDNSIVMLIFNRADYGPDINISLPQSFTLTPEIREAFITTKFIPWKNAHAFTLVDRRISRELIKISIFTYGNSIATLPVNGYSMTTEKALSKGMKTTGNLKPLEKEEGLEFFLKHWKWAKEGTKEYYKTLLESNPTSGVYVGDEVATAAIIQGHGIIGGLVTPQEHQRKGYATECMKFMLQEMARAGYLPFSSTLIEHTTSNALHKKVGLEVTHIGDYIFHIPVERAIV